MRSDYARVDESVLRDYTAAILRGARMSEEGARIAAAVLVMSDARGIESHGVARLPQYVNLIDAGVLDPAAVPEVERESASTVLVNAHNGMGQVAGDYAIGSNHVLPTAGAARVRGGLSAADFVRQITVQRLTAKGLRSIGPGVIELARAEGLEGHARSIEIRVRGAGSAKRTRREK